jgi:aspartokinase-like uncharacterized kinase
MELSPGPPILVAKVGGSLLTWPGLPEALRRWLDTQADRRVVLVSGGGRAADFVRELDRLHSLGEESSHTLALRSLDLSAHALAAIVPGLVVVEDTAAMEESWTAGGVPVLAPRRTLDADDPHTLEHSWRVTTDAIAARLAILFGAELILLKSAPIPPGLDRTGAAHVGLVDEAFPEVSRPISRVAYLNLRERTALTPRLI